jgi:hypothetical protein
LAQLQEQYLAIGRYLHISYERQRQWVEELENTTDWERQLNIITDLQSLTPWCSRLVGMCAELEREIVAIQELIQ